MSVSPLNDDVLQTLCERFGVDARLPQDSPPVEVRESGASVQPVRNRARTSIDAEEGYPGTHVDDSGEVRPAVEKYGARKVRGTHGDWGLYEEHFRGEPQIFQPITSIGEILAGSTYEVQPPDQIEEGHEPWVERYCDWTEGWLQSLNGGPLARHVREAAETLLVYGPCVHEVVWGVSDPPWTARRWKHPVKFAYREPKTYEQWHLSDDESELVAVEFDRLEGGGEKIPAGTKLYPRHPRERPDWKVLHAAYHQRGNNFDGVAPQRPAIQYTKLKHLLVQIAGLAADKYGVPIPSVLDTEVEVDADIAPPTEGSGDVGDKDDLFRDVQRIRAGQAPVLKIPAGLGLEYKAPPGSMPKLMDLLEYCDQQIAQCFSNEGALLGQRSAVGSYALGEVSDNKFVRQAPAVARQVLQPISDLIRAHATQYLEPMLGERLLAYPTVEVRLGVGKDADEWLGSLRELMGNRPITEWPEKLRRKALDKLDLPADVLQRDDAGKVGGTEQTQSEEGDETGPDDEEQTDGRG